MLNSNSRDARWHGNCQRGPTHSPALTGGNSGFPCFESLHGPCIAVKRRQTWCNVAVTLTVTPRAQNEKMEHLPKCQKDISQLCAPGPLAVPWQVQCSCFNILSPIHCDLGRDRDGRDTIMFNGDRRCRLADDVWAFRGPAVARDSHASKISYNSNREA